LKNIELLTDAYRLCGIIDETEVPSAEQGVLALRKLNQMMELWAESEIELQYYEQTDQDAEFPCQRYTEQGVTGKLAEALAAHYGITLSPESVAYANAGYAVIERKAVLAKREPLSMAHLPMGSGHASSGNILTGDD
jgi:hypothetical protein